MMLLSEFSHGLHFVKHIREESLLLGECIKLFHLLIYIHLLLLLLLLLSELFHLVEELLVHGAQSFKVLILVPHHSIEQIIIVFVPQRIIEGRVEVEQGGSVLYDLRRICVDHSAVERVRGMTRASPHRVHHDPEVLVVFPVVKDIIGRHNLRPLISKLHPVALRVIPGQPFL